MKAIVKRVPKSGIEIADVENPKIGSRDVLVKIKAAAYCGSDIHIYKWDEQPIKGNWALPSIVGHEFCGDVVEIGDKVKRLKPGDIIAGETHIPCEQCYFCKTGRMHICENLKVFGVHTYEGSFAEYAVIPEIIAYKLPEGTSYEEGALYEPCGVAMHAVQRTHPKPGDTAVVLGCGPIGVFIQQIMNALGSKVVATDIKPYRIEIAKKIGAAKEVINAAEEDVEERLKSILGERGPDIVFEAAGSINTIKQSLEIVAKCGKVVLFGTCPENPTLDTTSFIVYKEIDVLGVFGRYIFDTWYRVQKLVSDKKIDLTSVITHRFPLEKAEEGFQLIMKGEASKVILNP